MPTIVTKTIKPGGGGDYTTLEAAEAALQSNLVTADQQLVLECYAGNVGLLEFTPGAWTVDATRNIVVTVHPSARHAGVYSTSGKAYLSGDLTAGPIEIQCGIVNFPNYTVIEWLQIEQTANESNVRGISNNNSIGCHIRYNIVKPNPASTTNWSAGAAGIYGGTDVAGNNYIYNNIVYGWNIITGNAGITTVNHASGKTYCYNNTVVGCDIGIKDTYNGIVAKNNLCSGNTTDFSSAFGTGSDYNASSDTSAPGASARISQTFTFANAGSKDYHLASGDAGAKTYGADLSADGNLAIAYDIDGQARSAPFDIGADQYVSATPPGRAAWKNMTRVAKRALAAARL